jgi:uncharacterized repeat protein (TIGR01451 family)
MKNFSNRALVAMVAVLGLMVASGAMAASADLTSSITSGPATIAPGATGDYTVAYGNNGPDEALNAYLNINLPAGVPASFDEVTQDQIDIMEASYTDSLGNAPLTFADSSCEGLLIQVQGPSETRPDPLGSMTSGASGEVGFSIPFPMDNPKSGTVEVTEPADLAGSLLHLGTGCDDCADLSSCFGARLTAVTGTPTPWEVVSDGTAAPTEGCNELVDFTAGNIAVIRRGTCDFGLKALNAENAGASAVVIVNSTTPAPDQLIPGMAAGDFGTLVTIPTVMITFNAGEPIIAAIEGGATVMGVVGGKASPEMTFSTDSFHSVAADTDPDPSNDGGALVTMLSGGGGTAPTASFQYAPANPTEGQSIQFADTSTGGPTSWAWDFGDGESTTDQNPTHAFAAAGTYTVSLTATNADGSDTASETVTVAGGGGELNNFYFVAAAAKAAGAEGTFFLTDADIQNAGTTTANYQFLWLPRNTDNATPMASTGFTLGAGMAVRYTDVLGAAFGLEDGALGALAVISDSSDLLLMSRTYNATDTGTFGQAIPGMAMDQLIPENTRMRVLFMTQNDDYRSNLGIMNGTGFPMTVNWERFGPDGVSIGTGSVDLAAWGNTQINTVFSDVAPIEAAYVDVWTTTTGGMFGAYGSVLDALTGDPTTVMPQ